MRRANNNNRNDGGNNTFDTINAAAFAISTHNRVSQPSNQKKRWGSWLSIAGCFGYSKTNRKRIGHAVLVPEAATPATAAPVINSASQPPSITLPFVAPPSSPASFFQSEPPSTVQSPIGIVSVTSVSASCMYSPGGPASIFAIGPYAHETQLVSPPVFSASSTAPFTPPPESVHLTTPSSPEVPFAQLLDPNNRNSDTYQRLQISHYDFQSYQFHPGSPVGQLISPRSAISASGASSPFPDSDSHILDPAKFLNLDKISTYENQKSNHGSGVVTPDNVRSTAPAAGFLPNHWVSEIKISPHPNKNRLNETSVNVNHRVSFELSAQKVLSSVENKPAAAAAAASTWTKVRAKLKNDAATVDKEENSGETVCDDKHVVAESPIDEPPQTSLVGDVATVDEKEEDEESLTLSTTKEFNFGNADGADSHAPNIVADWWANEKVAGKEGGASKDWSFFPMIQPGVS